MDREVTHSSGGMHATVIGVDDIDDYYKLHVDSNGRLLIRNQVVDPDTLEWVNQVQGQAVGGEEEVAVTNWPSTQAVSGPLTDTELRASPIDIASPSYAQAVYEDGDVLYICKGEVGSSLSDAVWQIQRFDSGSVPMQTLWCDGNANFDNRATNLGTVQGHTYL